MKLFFIAITLVGSQFTFAQNWHKVSSGTDQKLNSVHFVNASLGFIVGNDSLLLKTIDGGKIWNRQAVNIPFGNTKDIIDVWFEDEQQGYVIIGPYGGLYFTLNGGTTWQLDSTLNNTNMCFKRSMYFDSMDDGYIGGSMCFQGETVAKKANGVWGTPAVIGSWDADDQITNFDFLNSQKGFATSTGKYIFKTTDAGATWDSVYSSIDSLGTSDVVFINDTLAYATFPNLGSSGILITTDGGNTWAADWSAATFFYPGFNAVTKDAFGTAYFGGTAGWAQNGLVFTKKLGKFWLFDQVDQPIHDLTVSYDSVVFAVGDSGLIVTNVIPQTIGISEQYNSLFKVYPNPSSGIYKLEGAESAEVIIYNALVTEVLKIDSFKLNEEIDLSSQIDGVYFIHVKTAKTTEMIKVVKQH